MSTTTIESSEAFEGKGERHVLALVAKLLEGLEQRPDLVLWCTPGHRPRIDIGVTLGVHAEDGEATICGPHAKPR